MNLLRNHPSKRRVRADSRINRCKCGRTRENRRDCRRVGVGDAEQKLQHSAVLLETAASAGEVAIAGEEISKGPDTSRRLIVTPAKCFGKCRARFQICRVVGRDCLRPRNLGKRHHARVLGRRGRRRKGGKAPRHWRRTLERRKRGRRRRTEGRGVRWACRNRVADARVLLVDNLQREPRCNAAQIASIKGSLITAPCVPRRRSQVAISRGTGCRKRSGLACWLHCWLNCRLLGWLLGWLLRGL